MSLYLYHSERSAMTLLPTTLPLCAESKNPDAVSFARSLQGILPMRFPN